MKKVLCVLAALALLIAPASAKIGEAEVSGSYSDSDQTGEIASVSGGVYAPVFGRFLLGPAGKFSYFDPKGGGSTTGSAGGVVLEWHVTKNERGVIPFLRAEGYKWFGEVESTLDYEYSVGGGFKIGDDATALKITVVKTWVEGTDDDRTDARIGFAWRL